jgi:hypothetical protein
MSEVCVCGHEKEQHGKLTDSCYGDDCCLCSDYRPVKPWPDSEGWYWMKSSCSFGSDSMVYAMQSNRAFVIQIAGTGPLLPQEDFDQRHRWCADGPVRFVKLQEQNPFTGATP